VNTSAHGRAPSRFYAREAAQAGALTIPEQRGAGSLGLKRI